MTLLQIIQEFCRRTGLSVPVIAASSNDDQILQYMGLLNEILDDLEKRRAYTFLQKEGIITATGDEDQGSLLTLFPDFESFLTQYFFNRTTNEVIYGPIPPDAWQAKAAGLYAVSETRFRIFSRHLYLSPAPAAGDSISFEYQTKYPVMDEVSVPSSYKRYFSLDTDTTLYPDSILIAGLRWTWKREKGIRYGEDFRNYEEMVKRLSGKDGNPRQIKLDEPSSPVMGIQVPDRSWPL